VAAFAMFTTIAVADRNLKLSANEVHIWRIGLAGPADYIQHCRGVLSQDECDRADRFYFEEHRNRFILARAAMRQILGFYAGCMAQELVFSYGAKGKPELADGLKEHEIEFNLSHSHETALLGVSRGQTLGLDIERINLEFATEDIAERFFSPAEVSNLQGLPPQRRAEAFFSCWTRKEAYIKALGEGLSVPLDSFEVAFVPGVAAALLHVDVDPGEVSRWSMYDIDAPMGYKSALVVEGREHRLQQMLYKPEH